MNAHTPGHWHSTRLSKTTWNVGIYGPDGSTLAVINNASALSSERRDADARLMAAAPELLAALAALLDKHPGTENVLTLKARAVIAKATGGKS